MAVSFVSQASNNNGTTGASPTYPTSPTAGNLLLLLVANKHDEHTVTTPSGWTAPSNNTSTGGAGTDGTDDEGTVRVTAFYKVADGSETGTLTVSVIGGNVTTAQIFQFSRSGGTAWDVACAIGSKNTGGTTTWAITTSSDPGIAGGDMVVTLCGANTDSFTYSTSASPLLTSGITYGALAKRNDASNAQGADLRFIVHTHAVTSGTSSGNSTFNMTSSGSSSNAPAGAMVLVRLREGSATALTDVDTDETILAGQASIAYTGSGLTNADGLMVQTGTKEAAATSFSATNDTSGTFTAPTAASIRTAGVKFGTCTFSIEDGGVALATLAGTINPSSGLTVHNVTDISQAADTGCIYYGQSPAVAVGDQILFDSSTGSNAWAVTIDSQGFVTIDAGGSTAADTFSYYIWDATDETWGTVGTWTINNSMAQNIWQWIETAQGGSAARATTVMAYLIAQGYTNQGINSGLFNWLGGLGYTGGLNSRIRAFEEANTGRYN